MKVAEQYIFDRDWQGDIRFDVVSVVITQNTVKIQHIEDAFY
jgi:putative endonuclease